MIRPRHAKLVVGSVSSVLCSQRPMLSAGRADTWEVMFYTDPRHSRRTRWHDPMCRLFQSLLRYTQHRILCASADQDSFLEVPSIHGFSEVLHWACKAFNTQPHRATQHRHALQTSFSRFPSFLPSWSPADSCPPLLALSLSLSLFSLPVSLSFCICMVSLGLSFLCSSLFFVFSVSVSRLRLVGRRPALASPARQGSGS